MDSDRDLYQILQIDPAAEQEVVQAAFKRLALKYHPDKNPSLDANHRMQELNDAYAVISDPVQRAAYDRERREKLTAQRQAEAEARYRAEAERRAEASQLRREQEAANRKAENERREKARAAAAQRRVEYEQQIRAQQAAQRRAKRERQQREWEAQQAAAQAAAEQAAVPIGTPVEEAVEKPGSAPEALPTAVPEAPVRDEVEQNPIDTPVLSERERRQLALRQSQRALQDQLFKLDYGIADAVEQINYWSRRRFPWQIDVKAGHDTLFIIGVAVTIVALLLAGFMLTLGGAAGWAAAFGLVGIGTGWWTWRTCLSIMPIAYLVDAWTEIKRGRDLQRKTSGRGTRPTGSHHAGERRLSPHRMNRAILSAANVV